MKPSSVTSLQAVRGMKGGLLEGGRGVPRVSQSSPACSPRREVFKSRWASWPGGAGSLGVASKIEVGRPAFLKSHSPHLLWGKKKMGVISAVL